MAVPSFSMTMIGPFVQHIVNFSLFIFLNVENKCKTWHMMIVLSPAGLKSLSNDVLSDSSVSSGSQQVTCAHAN